MCYFFFFQAEDGIRDYKVTGVQTCALPISCAALPARRKRNGHVADPLHAHQQLPPAGSRCWRTSPARVTLRQCMRVAWRAVTVSVYSVLAPENCLAVPVVSNRTPWEESPEGDTVTASGTRASRTSCPPDLADHVCPAPTKLLSTRL